MKTAYGYIRVSKERKDGISPEQQKEKITLQARIMGVDLVRIYEDLDISGRSDKRPAFQELMAEVKKGGVDCVLVYKIDRFARNVNNFHKAMSVFDSSGCALVSISQNFDTSSPTGRLLRNILADFAQFESEMISERVRDNKVANAARGRWNGGNCPYGYKVIDKQLFPHEEEADIVRSLFDLAAKGKGALSLVKWLDGQGIAPRRGTVYGSGWSESTVRYLLTNKVYLGQVTYAGETHEGSHESLIEETLFNAVQAQTARRKQIQKEHRNSPHLLGGLLWCPYCNHFSIQTRYNGKNKVRRHVCNTKKLRGVDACQTKNIDADGLEAAVTREVFALAHGHMEKVRAGAKAELHERTAEIVEKRPAIEAEIRKLERQMKRLFSDYYDDNIITRDQFLQKNQEYLDRQKTLSGRLGSIQQVEAANTAIDEDFNTLSLAATALQEAWGEITAEEKRTALQRVIRRVIIYRDYAEIDFSFFTKKIAPAENAEATLFF